MLIKDYFQQQKKQGLSTAEKFLLYEKISLGHKNSQHGISRKFSMRNRLLKMGVFSLILAFLGVGLFKGFSDKYNNNKSILTFREAINENNYSHASAIGQIIKAQGHFTIVKDGQLVISDNFSDGDILSLDKFSTMIFNINDSIQAKVVGPAKFTVHKLSGLSKKTSYRIHMLEGNFISVKSKDNKIAQQSVEVTTPDGVIIQETKENESEKIDFSMVKKDKKALVYNKGTNKIKVVQNKTTNSQKINSKLSVVNQEDIDNGEKIEGLTKEIVDLVDHLDSLSSGEISISNNSGTVSFGGYSTGNDISGGNVVSEDDSGNDFTEVSVINKSQINIITKQQKQIIDLKNITYKTFIKGDIENIFKYYLLGQKQPFDISVSNLSKRLEQVYNILGSQDKFKTSYTISDLYNTTNSLLQIIKEKNIITNNSFVSNIIVLKNRLFLLKNSYSFGEYSSILNSGDNENITFDDFTSQIGFNQKEYLLFK